MVAKLDGLLHEPLAKRTAPYDGATVIVLDGTGENLGGRSRSLIDEDHEWHLLIRAASVTTILLTGRLSALGIDNQLPLGEELIGNLHGRGQIAAGIATQVDDQIGEALLRELCQGDEQFGIGILAEILNLNVASLVVEHIRCGDTLHGYLASGYSNVAQLGLTITEYAQLHLRIPRSFQTVHGFLIGHLLTHEHRVVDLNNLVASHHTSPLSWSVADDILHTDGVLADGKLDTDAREGTLQVVVGNLYVLGSNVD